MIEVLFAAGVLGLCLVSLTIAITSSVKNTRFSKNSALANKYVQEGIELARRERDRADNWIDFRNNFDGDWCLNNNLDWSQCDCSAANPPSNVGIFFRCLNFIDEGDSEKRKIIVDVSWQEGGRSHKVESITFLTKWND